MKVVVNILWALLAVTILAVAVLFLIGGWKGEFHYRAKATVHADSYLVSECLTDPEKLEEWMDSLVEKRPIGSAEVDVGSKAKEVYRIDGKRVEMETEVVEYEEGKLLVLQVDTDQLGGTSRYELQPKGRRTDVRHVLALQYKGFFNRLLSPIYAESSRERTEADLLSLKKFAESQ